jgi:lysozyme
MQTSAQGIVALELEEGVVLKAYRDAVGVWTIGAGLTASSGVVRPKSGMVITRADATNLTQLALRKKYEPAVEAAMSGTVGSAVRRPQQCEFDAGVSFHWNTGAISRASWVRLWKAKAGAAKIRAALLAWNKGGGKVLPGLTARRDREAAMLLAGRYRGAAAASAPSQVFASWGLMLTDAEKASAIAGFKALGYATGDTVDAVLKTAAIAFQKDYDLTPDGIIGRATLSTLQRQLDARAKAKTTAAVVAAPVATASIPAGTSDFTDVLLALPHADAVLIAAGALYGVTYLYRYRDSVAAKLAPTLPRVAALLRSF